ncbi:unnamed protein product [Danaus chrysippus]|uniref:(African queen) hypothetical protein n=1 Tax=Danaus chrysippus TaxID=151541 RepID=A0A8J2VYT0_9NEOP|nr:unnamed protein product [Danaus chrysippus]
MPPVFHLDDYDDCMINPQGLYCFVDVNLVSDGPNEVLVMIQDLNETDLITNHHLPIALEGCFNESIYQDYRLKTRVSHVFCVDNKKEVVLDAGDIALGVFIFIVLALNVIGSLYDVILIKGNKNQGIKPLLCFSVPRNYRMLLSHHQKSDVILSEERFVIFDGLKTITMMCVIYCHSLMIFAFEPENPHHIEQISVAKEVEDCRQNGWANLLYINNYMVNSQCLGQSWYLGAAMQLSIVGYIVCILPKTVKVRNIALTILFVIGILTPAVHTYYQDLDAVLMITPETARVFEGNPTFNYVYRMGHTNITNFIVGIVLGYSIYRWQKTGETLQRYKIEFTLASITVTFILSVPFWLLMNTPLTQLLKWCVGCLLQMKEEHETEKKSKIDKNSVTLEVKNENQREVGEHNSS